jgi:glycosyltransferase involved in cell wall biosynthesis
MQNEEVNRLHGLCHYRPPRVSVVIPCYNAEKYIEECVLSVLKQDYKPIEVIVVDDASTDSSVPKIAEYPISISKNITNMGECKTSAKGFAMASGEYICRLSADDMFISKSHIARQVKEMEKHNLDWCYNNINLSGRDLNTAVEIHTSWVPIPLRFSSGFFNVFDNLFLCFQNLCYLIAIRRNPINSSALMIRADTYRKSASWDNNLRSVCDGSLLGKLLLMNLKVRAIPAMGVFYRIHPGQATGQAATNDDLGKVRNMLCEEINNNLHPFWMKYAVRFFYG